MTGQIIEPNLVAAPRQRNTLEDKQEIKAGRIPPARNELPAEFRQRDQEALDSQIHDTQLQADGTPPVDIAISAFGYQNHIAIDREHGLNRSSRPTRTMRICGRESPEPISMPSTSVYFGSIDQRQAGRRPPATDFPSGYV